MAAVAEMMIPGVHTLLGFCREGGDCESGEIEKQLLIFLNVAGMFLRGKVEEL
jgi:hypothetical protein